MKSFTFLVLAIFAAVAIAAPALEDEEMFDVSEVKLEPQDAIVYYKELKDLGFTDEELETYASVYASLVQKLMSKIKSLYNKVCQKNNSDVCKRWAKQNITKENVEKLWREIKPLVKKYCANKTNALCTAVKIIL